MEISACLRFTKWKVDEEIETHQMTFFRSGISYPMIFRIFKNTKNFIEVEENERERNLLVLKKVKDV